MNKVHELPASVTFTPEQAIKSMLNFCENDDITDVLCIGYDSEGSLIVRSSRMDCKDALWLAEQLKIWALNAIYVQETV